MIQKAVKALDEVNPTRSRAFSTQVPDNGTVQITSELNAANEDDGNVETTSEFDPFVSSVRSSCGEPRDIFHVALNQSAFGPDGPANANVVEHVQNFFAASRKTPEFRKQIKEDFLKFDEIYSKGATGNSSLAFGWLLEEQEHDENKGEKASCFFVIRGWESMDHFEQSVKHDAYKEAIPLLFAWNAPWKMVSMRSAPSKVIVED